MARIKVHDRREALVDAALQVMSRGGVAAATTRAVVSEAGMSLASFHYAFTSRDEMLVEAMRRLVEELDDSPPPFPGEVGEDPAAVLRSRLAAVLGMLLGQPGMAAVMIELTTASLRSPAIAAMGAELTAARRRVLIRWFDEWASTHSVAWTTPTPTVATLVLAALDGLVLQWSTDRDDVGVFDALDALAASLTAQTRALVPATSPV